MMLPAVASPPSVLSPTIPEVIRGVVIYSTSYVYVELDHSKVRSLFEKFQKGKPSSRYEAPDFNRTSSFKDHFLGVSIPLVLSEEMLNRDCLSKQDRRVVLLNCLMTEKVRPSDSAVKTLRVCLVDDTELKEIRVKAGLTSLIQDKPFGFTFAIKWYPWNRPNIIRNPSAEKIDDVSEVEKHFIGQEFKGRLCTFSDGKGKCFVYLKIDDELVFKADEIFHRSNPGSRCQAPPYFKESPIKPDNPIGAHITVLQNKQFRQSITLDMIEDREYTFICNSVERIVPFWKIMKYMWIMTVTSSSLEDVRAYYRFQNAREDQLHFSFQVMYQPHILEQVEQVQREQNLLQHENEVRLQKEPQQNAETQAHREKLIKENQRVMAILNASTTEMKALKQLKGMDITCPQPHQIEKARLLGWNQVVKHLSQGAP